MEQAAQGRHGRRGPGRGDGRGLTGLLQPEAAQRVSDALRRSAFTVDALTARLGADAIAALARHDPAPVRSALGAAQDPQAALVRLLLLGEAMPAGVVGRVLPLPAASPLLRRRDGAVRPAYEVAPHADETHDWWVVSDRADARGRPRRADHVLGVGGASTTLAQLTVRRPVERALDVGTGCGVQALHLSTHATHVTATDSEPRALRLAATSLTLSGVEAELLRGDLAEPVRGREFDLVVCNPPFVVGPQQRFSYRDGGRAGDEMSRQAVRAAAELLAPGGVAQLLVNWLHVRGEDWRDRVGGWVTDLGCDALLLEREVQGPVDYVATWLADANEHDDERARSWLEWFAASAVDGVGFGWVVLRRGAAPHRVAVEVATQAVEQPLGHAVGAWLDRLDWLRDRDDDDLLGARLRPAPELRRDTVAVPAPDGWGVVADVLRLDAGLRWALPCDEATAALVAGFDGARPLRELVAVLALATGTSPSELAGPVCSTVRGLIDRGLLMPPAA